MSLEPATFWAETTHHTTVSRLRALTPSFPTFSIRFHNILSHSCFANSATHNRFRRLWPAFHHTSGHSVSSSQAAASRPHPWSSPAGEKNGALYFPRAESNHNTSLCDSMGSAQGRSVRIELCRDRLTSTMTTGIFEVKADWELDARIL